MVGNRGFWPRVTTALAKRAAGQVACRASCKPYISRPGLEFKDGRDIGVLCGRLEEPATADVSVAESRNFLASYFYMGPVADVTRLQGGPDFVAVSRPDGLSAVIAR